MGPFSVEEILLEGLSEMTSRVKVWYKMLDVIDLEAVFIRSAQILEFLCSSEAD